MTTNPFDPYEFINKNIFEAQLKPDSKLPPKKPLDKIYQNKIKQEISMFENDEINCFISSIPNYISKLQLFKEVL
jgi:hypothetical protein